MAWTVIIVGGIALLVIVVRVFWRKLKGLWEKAKEGGAILAHPRAYLVRVVLPSFWRWAAKLGVIAVFLAAYSIPVTFHTVMSVAGGNSLANTVSATPGGVGINQAINTASLSDVTTPANAAAYSTGQQLIMTALNVVFGAVLVVWAFGWSGGRRSSRARTPTRRRRSPSRRRTSAAKKEAKREQEEAEGGGNGLMSRIRRRDEEEP